MVVDSVHADSQREGTRAKLESVCQYNRCWRGSFIRESNLSCDKPLSTAIPQRRSSLWKSVQYNKTVQTKLQVNPISIKRLKCEIDHTEILSRFSKLAAQFQSMEVRNTNFAAFIDIFTSNTYVMVIMSDPTIRKYPRIQQWRIQNLRVLKFICILSASAATLINIRNARKHFEKLERASQSSALSR